MAKAPSKTVKITSCTGCPHVQKTYTGKGNHTFACKHPDTKQHWVQEGYVRADGSTGRVIAEECERPSEYPKSFPKWCPL